MSWELLGKKVNSLVIIMASLQTTQISEIILEHRTTAEERFIREWLEFVYLLQEFNRALPASTHRHQLAVMAPNREMPSERPCYLQG